MSKPNWTPAERQIPELLCDLMYMSSVTYGGRVIHQYKHAVTRRYINLDNSGQTWQVAVDPSTGDIGARRITLSEAKAHVLS